MAYVDADADATTFNSSTADLALPTGATVLFAGLYYGADASGGAGGVAPPDPSAAGRATVRFREPGDAAYTALTASVVDTSADNEGRYQGFVDVSDRVRAAGAGTYGVADVQAGTGSDHYAGWALVVAYRDAGGSPRNLSVYDGLATLAGEGPPTSIEAGGFTTPPAGPVNSAVSIVAYEGDLGSAQDAADLITSRGQFPLSDDQNPAANFFNRSISVFGSRFAAKTPDHVNQFGFDADLLSADDLLGNGDTGATIRVTTQGDQFLPGVVTFSTELYAPDVTPTASVVNVTHSGGPTRPGDTLRYAIAYANDGQDEADDFVVRDAIPTGAAYVPGSLCITGGPNAPAAPSDATGDDLGEYADGTVRFRLGTGASATEGGRLGDSESPTRSVTAGFDVRVDPVAADGSEILNEALATFTGGPWGPRSSISGRRRCGRASPGLDRPRALT